MIAQVGRLLFPCISVAPFVYYLIALYSSRRFFRQQRVRYGATPPASILKPIRGLDPGVYENLASLCRQDYPDYELLFCVGQSDDPVLPVIDKLVRDFPERSIRVLVGTGSSARNDKVAKLIRLVAEAKNEVLVMGDSDVRVRSDYLRSVVAPLSDQDVGAVTCFYMPANRSTLAEKLQTIGMVSDFYAGVLVAWQLDGVKFALGPTIVTTRARLMEFGGLHTIENRPGDDLLVGRLIAEQGHKVELIPYVVEKLAGYHSLRELLDKRLRWIVVMRHMRPWGHFGLFLTQGLPWALVAIAVQPGTRTALCYLGAYLGLRAAMTWSIGVLGLKQSGLWKEMLFIPVWDLLAFLIWLASFARNTVRWRGSYYHIRDGMLILAARSAPEGEPEPSEPRRI